MAAVFLHGPSSTLHTCPPSPALNPLQRRLILLGGLRKIFGSPTLSLELSTRIIKGRGLQCRNIMKEFSRTRSNFLLNAKALGPDSSIWPSQRKKKRRYGGCIAARADRSADELEYSKVWKEEDAKSRKKPSQVEEELVRQFLGEGSAEVEGGNTDDFVSKVLRDKPSQVEPKYLIGDRLYTLKEKELLQMPIWKKIAIALGLQRSDNLTRDSVESAERQLVEAKREEDEVGTSGRQEEGMQQLKSVFLSDLLREYKGNLYVPEEAFKEHVPEIEGFKRSLVILPRMTFDDFLKAMRSNQVEMLTSRGIPSPSSSYVYHDFIVDLKSVPGEKSLQMRKWAMHLTEKEAQVVFGEYAGPQREVETYCTPYVAPPPSSPNPLASSISGRVMLELTVVTGLVAAVAFTAGGIASAVAFLMASCVTVVVVHIIWPLASPFLRPLSTLFLMLMKGIGSFLFGSATGSRGLLGILSDIYRFVTFGSLFTTVRTLGAILFVAGTMGLLAKFTLTRRPKDFTKWDLWQAIEFGHSKPQARVEGSTGVLFEDVAGIDDVVEELQELVNYLKDPERFNQMGTKPPHGVLLEGPPGCGKTLLAKAIAGEAGVPFYQMAGSEFVEVLVGVGAARIRDLFKRAKVNRPSVVFIDEIDALGAMRHGGAEDEMEEYNAGAQERETTLNQLLIELDGFDTGKGVVFLGATNRMDMLDPALLRPGRFDRKVTIKPPRAKGRLDILKVHSKNVKLSPEVDLWLVAKNLPGWSGAELAQLLQEGALMAVRNGHDQILQKDLDQAMDRLNVGPERFGIGLGLPVHRRIATIEIGLAMTSHLLRRLENAELEYCERVSIVPRGETLSRTIFEHLDDEAYFFQRKHNFLHRMQVFLGGRAAEEVMFGRDTSDWSVVHLQDASWLARKLITIWNLEGPFTIHGEKAPWSNEPHFAGPPLDFEGWLYDDYELVEPSLNAGLDNEVAERTEALVRKCYNKTLMVLQHHHAALTKAIYVILEKHELFGDEIELILDSYPAGTPVDLVEDEEDPGALSLNPPSQNLAMIEDGTHTAGTPLVCIEKENVQHLETMQRGDYRRNGNEIPLSRNAEYPGKTVNGNGSGNGEARMKSLSEDSNNMEANSVGNIEGNTSISNGDGLGDATSDLSVEQTTTPARTRKQDLAD